MQTTTAVQLRRRYILLSLEALSEVENPLSRASAFDFGSFQADSHECARNTRPHLLQKLSSLIAMEAAKCTGRTRFLKLTAAQRAAFSLPPNDARWSEASFLPIASRLHRHLARHIS